MINKNIKGWAKGALLLSASLFTMTSCQDFFDVDQAYTVNAEDSHLVNHTDTIYSMIGILNKLQGIAERTILLGEARGDLVNITDATAKDLRDLANFNVSDEENSNKYNSPRDYYAVINNCNIYIANADTSKTDSHNEKIFLREYAAAKAIRAWTYLQLVTTYGSVPFITEPVTDYDKSMKEYPRKNLQEICNYFIDKDGLDKLADMDNVVNPMYGEIKSTPSQLFYFPIRIILGDLNLWAGRYEAAAKYYHDYLVKKNGQFDCYPTQVNRVYWGDTKWNEGSTPANTWSSIINTESKDKYAEVITIIPMDSVASEGYYGELRSIFNSSYAQDNDHKVSLVPSQSLINLSAAQTNIYYDLSSNTFLDVPKNIDDYKGGDLRLWSVWKKEEGRYTQRDGSKTDYQEITKFNNKNGNVHIYRKSQIYLRYAEAMNQLGYPFYAWMILAKGVTHQAMEDTICSKVYNADSTYLMNNFDFPENSGYYAIQYLPMYERIYGGEALSYYQRYANIGIHDHGCGWAGYAEYNFKDANIYPMPTGTLEEQKKAVEDLIMDENALEMAFEGTRFYDLMRVALRRNDPSYLANRINARNGSKPSGITKDLNNPKNWYLKYGNKIGF